MVTKKHLGSNPQITYMWYKQWLSQVDKWCLELAGISYKDLPDYDFVVNYEDAMTPEEMARMMLKEEGAL